MRIKYLTLFFALSIPFSGSYGQIFDTTETLFSNYYYVKVFEDKFNDGVIDNSKWRVFDESSSGHCEGRVSSANSPSHVNETSNGGNEFLKIHANDNSYGECDFTSGRVETKKSFKYGKYKIKFKARPVNEAVINYGFWLVDRLSCNDGDKAYYSEIDIFEHQSHHGCFSIEKGTHKFGLACNDQPCMDCPYSGHNDAAGDKFNTDHFEWNTTTLVWAPDSMTLFVNGIRVLGEEVTIDQPMHIQLSAPIWRELDFSFEDGLCGTRHYPGVFKIDYVKYWKPVACDKNLTECNYINPYDYPLYNYENIELSPESCDPEGEAIVPSHARLNAIASEKITLGPGFKAEAGGRFHARIEGCPGERFATKNGENEKGSKKKNQKGLAGSLSLKTYPNPVTDKLTVSFSEDDFENLKYSVRDLAGRKVKSGNLYKSDTQISFKSIKSGIYVLMAYNDNHFFRKRIVKK